MRKMIIQLIIVIIAFTGCNISKEVKLKEITIMEETSLETKAYLYNDDPQNKFRFVIVGGIHGNETAGYNAAESLMESIPYDYPNATVLFIPHANQLAITENVRYNNRYEDLNRAFLNDEGLELSETKELAYEIFQLIKSFNPKFVIDHHESLDNYMNIDGKYKLGNTVIVSDVDDSMVDLLIILDNINPLIEGDIPFILEGNPPRGSFNWFISKELNIFVGTIETNRKLELSKRIDEQLIVANEIINYFKDEEE